MANNNFTEELAAWELMVSGLRANQDDLPYLMSSLAQLEGVVAALRALQITRAALALESLQGTQNLNAGFAQAKALASRLRSSVVGHYGHGSAKLTEFGLELSRRGRKPGGPQESHRTVR